MFALRIWSRSTDNEIYHVNYLLPDNSCIYTVLYWMLQRNEYVDCMLIWGFVLHNQMFIVALYIYKLHTKKSKLLRV